MGYGFAIERNIADSYAMVLSRPSPGALEFLRQRLPERYQSAEWSSEEALFLIRPSWHFNGSFTDSQFPYLRSIDPDLIITLHAIIAAQMAGQVEHTPVELWSVAIDAVLGRLEECRDYLDESGAALPEEPFTRRAQMAKIYRDNQLQTVQEAIDQIETFLYRVYEGEEDLGALLLTHGLVTSEELAQSAASA
jgi:hypothetical protein